MARPQWPRDFGEYGIKETLSLCAKHDIDVIGAGVSLPDAQKIYYRTIKQRCLAIINAAKNEFANATESRGGANPLNIITLLSYIRGSRKHL